MNILDTVSKNKALWLAVAVVVLTNVVSLGVYHLLFGARDAQVGVIDMAEILSTARGQYFKLLSSNKDIKISEQAAQEYLDSTGAKVHRIVQGIEHDCGCILLAKGTVIWSHGMRDYTKRVIAELQNET